MTPKRSFFVVTSSGSNMVLRLCHSLVRSVLYGALSKRRVSVSRKGTKKTKYAMKSFTERNKEDEGRKGWFVMLRNEASNAIKYSGAQPLLRLWPTAKMCVIGMLTHNCLPYIPTTAEISSAYPALLAASISILFWWTHHCTVTAINATVTLFGF